MCIRDRLQGASYVESTIQSILHWHKGVTQPFLPSQPYPFTALHVTFTVNIIAKHIVTASLHMCNVILCFTAYHLCQCIQQCFKEHTLPERNSLGSSISSGRAVRLVTISLTTYKLFLLVFKLYMQCSVTKSILTRNKTNITFILHYC